MQLNEQALIKELKSEKPAHLFLLYGSETYLIQLYIGQIVERAIGQKRDSFSYQELNGKETSVETIVDACQTFSLLGEGKCVVVKDLAVDKLKQAELDMLYELLEGLEERTTLVLAFYEQGQKPGAKFTKLFKEGEKRGIVAKLEPRTAGDLKKFVVSYVKKQGAEIKAPLAEKLVALCGEDMARIRNECDKLVAFKKGGEVDEASVDALVCATTEATAFELSRAILQGNRKNAFFKLQQLFELREAPVAILSAISLSFIDLYRGRVAQTARASQEQVVADFRYKGREFRVRNALRDCGSYSTAFLRSCIQLIKDTDRQLKSVKTDDQVLLQELVAKLFYLRDKERKA